MNDPGLSKLALLRFLERVQLRDLDRTRQWIAAEERREQERQRGIEARPPQPDWMIEQSLSRDVPAVYVHRGDCWNASKRSTGITRDQAVRALTEGIDACPHCRPDSELGILD